MATAATLAQDLADHIDHHHPKLGSALMKLRFGGLRTVEPSPAVVGAVLSVGAGGGLGVRRWLGARVPAIAAVPRSMVGAAGAAVAWLGLWRWDAGRWRRSHVMIVVDLPDERLGALVSRLGDLGLDVQRWDRLPRADGPRHGVACRLRDLRRVNAEIDLEMTGAIT